MKKIILSIFSLLALAACVKEELPQSIQPESDMVSVTFGVQVPEAGSATRVMGAEAINTLHLIVFDEQGYFTYKAAATLVNGEFPNDPTKRQFSVELPNSSAKRIIHFVANVSDQYNAINSGHEDGVMSGLYVTGQADAYWQRIEYNGGIVNDASTDDFDKGAIIPLVRNYAKISVQSATNSGFTLKGFKVFNTYTEGSIAAYDGKFAKFVEMNAATDSEGRVFTPYTYDEMNGYGCNEMGELNTNGIGDYASTAAAYVRETPYVEKSTTNAYIIIYGTYSGSDYYYKLEFGGKHLYRNFEYIFNISSVTKAGYTSEEAAKASTAEGSGLSYDKSTQNLLNLSDGKSQLYVSAMTIVMVNNQKTYELKYKYVPDIATGVVDNSLAKVSWVAQDNKVISNLAYTATTTDSEGYTAITITPATTMPTSAERTVITISDGKNLAREVNVYLMPAYAMGVIAYDGNVGPNDTEVAASIGQKVWVDVAIPTNVQEALFPLEFLFESSALSIYPDASASNNNMPVRTGQSIIPNSTATSFGFVYTLTWEEYVDLKNKAGEGASTVTFTAQFLTNKAASASKVYVYNEYFDTENGEFTNGGSSGGNTGGDNTGSGNTGSSTTLDLSNVIVGSGQWGGLSNNTEYDVSIYKSNNYNSNNLLGTVDNVKVGDKLSGTIDITGLNDSSTIYFRIAVRSGNSNNYYTASATVSQIRSGTTLNFTYSWN